MEGGLKGWSAVLGSWLIHFSMVGAIMAFGSYQTFYENKWLKDYSGSSIAWIGSLQLFLELFLGIFSGLLLDAGLWSLTVRGGSLLFLFAFFMLSLCHQGQYPPILLSQGIGMGAGLGFAYLAVSGIVSKHFVKSRSLAMGIITTGTSLGGFAFSALGSKLLDSETGFAWTVRINAFIALGCIVLANMLISNPDAQEEANESLRVEEQSAEVTEREKPNSRFPSPLLRDPAYIAVMSSGLIVSLGLYFPMFVIQTFALQHGISPGLDAWLLSMINISSVLGRTIPNWMADKFGTLEVYIPCTAASAALTFALGGATTPGSIIAICLLYGFFSGSVVSLYFPTICSLDLSTDLTGMRLGVSALPVSIASLVGTPISEALVGRQNDHWWRGIIFAGTTEMIAAALLVLALVVEKRKKARGASHRR